MITNAVVTLVCGGVIFYKVLTKQLEKHIFYYAWSFGFLLYGIEIVSRAGSFPLAIQVTTIFLAFLLFMIGIWSLSRKKNFFYGLTIVYFVGVAFVLFLISGIIPINTAAFLGSFLTYLPMALSILYHRFQFGRNVDKLAFGWFLLYLSNLLLWGTDWIIEVFAIVAKFIILLGIIDYDFVILTERIRRGLTPHLPPASTGGEKEGGLRIINHSPHHSSNEEKVRWIHTKAKKNTENNVKTFVFSFQDVIPHRELRRIKWVDPEKVFVFLFSNSAKKVEEEFTAFPMGITEVGAATSEVTRNHSSLEKGCTLIFADLSLLVHSLGVYPVYNMLLDKMGSIREGGVDLFAFFHPETHSDKSVVSLFTSIADEVITL